MDFVINSDQIDSEDFSGASIYLDACFILTYLDKTDNRRPEVARVLDVWTEYEDVVLGMSNHTVTEVINRVFQMLVLGSLQVYHEKNRLINQTRNGYEQLSEIEQQKLLNLESARFLYSLAKREDILDYYNKKVNANIKDLIKHAKEDEEKRPLLDIYYHTAVSVFNIFILALTEEMGFEIEFLDSLEYPHYEVAKANMRIMQLDIADSFHLAIAKDNDYDFLATLDSDFVHNFYTRDPNLTTRIIKVA